MIKEFEYELIYCGFHILKYKDENIWYLSYRDTYYEFKKLKKCLWFCRQRHLRIKRKKLNRKKRNSAKLLARKWIAFFNDNEETTKGNEGMVI